MRIVPTCTDHLLDLEMSGIYFTGKLLDGLTGVIISGGVHVIFNCTWNKKGFYEQSIFFIPLFINMIQGWDDLSLHSRGT